MRSQSGQVVLILVLVMTVALAIGISVIQRSLSDISTSSKVEQSSRAFSAAEAGIEKALSCPTCAIAPISFENQSGATVTNADEIPVVPTSVSLQGALGIPPMSKDEVAQIWLADSSDTHNPPAEYYKPANHSLNVYWGDPGAGSDKAALELTLVYYDGTSYQPKKWYLDSDSTRAATNNFDGTSFTCTGNYSLTGYLCKKTISSLPSGLMLLRARMLYNNSSQPFAVQSAGNCSTADTSYCIPPQARNIISTGTAGSTQRTVKVFSLDKVVPPYFDYAIFSVGDINK